MTIHFSEQLWSDANEKVEYRFSDKRTALRDLKRSAKVFHRGLVERVDEKKGERRIIATLGRDGVRLA